MLILRTLGVGFVVLVGGFAVYQILAVPVALVGLAVLNGVDAAQLLTPLGYAALVETQPLMLLQANAVGQVVGFGAFSLLLAWWLRRSAWASFLRLGSDRGGAGGGTAAGRGVLLGLLGWVGITPLVLLLGHLNQMIPLPEAVEAFEREQNELIARVLTAELGLLWPLLLVAVVPAFCEEVFFRGLIQRIGERAVHGLVAAIAVGIVFGAYHFRFSQVLPLAFLGCYLGYLTWRTGSLWPAVVVHFVNNAAAIVLGFASSGTGAEEAAQNADVAADIDPVLGGALVVLGCILAALVVAALERPARRLD
jgi:membrane protease YdiL (CAAX protease family)